jgi:hypothetical protein
MIYQREIVLNELSVSLLKEQQDHIESILKDFFDICLCIYKISGKRDAEDQNLRYIRYYSSFDWKNYLPDNQSIGFYLKQIVSDEIERDIIQSLLAEYITIDTFPHYFEFDGEVCNGLAYAKINNFISISLNSNEKFDTEKLLVQDVKLDENVDEIITQIEVYNVTTKKNAFDLLEEFARSFYNNTHHERPYFHSDSKDKKGKNFTHNLLPLKEISNEYLDYKNTYQTNKNDRIGSEREVTSKKHIAKIVANVNGWEKCNTSGRDIYKHQDSSYYLSVDTEKGDFEIHDSKGHHCGAISFDCVKQEKAKNHKITPC